MMSTKFTRNEAQAVIDELRAEAAHLQEMTLDEINEEIRATREDQHNRDFLARRGACLV